MPDNRRSQVPCVPGWRAAFAGLAGLAVMAAVSGGAFAQQPAARPLDPAAERGRQVAERACAACHAIEVKGDSPSAMAPPFRALRMRYNPISLERHIGALAASGYYGMPPQQISAAEAQDLAAYIETVHAP